MNDRAAIEGNASPDKESCVVQFLGKYRGTVLNNVDPRRVDQSGNFDLLLDPGVDP